MTKTEIIEYLKGENSNELFAHAAAVKEREVGTKTYLRGLIELSNRCVCDCLYCGIRASNSAVSRYELSEEQVLESAKFAYQNGWGSVVIQSGEVHSERFTNKIEQLVKSIKELSSNQLAITLSCGEQRAEVYQKWFDAGAERYLLRIESSNRELFQRIHPPSVSYDNRLECIQTLQQMGYQTGSGVMIGLPFQTVEHLADDIEWLVEKKIVMVGMGPYLEHHSTPLLQTPTLYSKEERLRLTLTMIALLRIAMPRINIASTTALSTIDPEARYKAMKIGANVLMPNITPPNQRAHYNLYENKNSDLDFSELEIAHNEQGTSLEWLSNNIAKR